MAAIGKASEARATPRRILFISSNPVWGGSEELWSRAAAALAEDGHLVSVLKARVDETVAPIRRLRELGCWVGDFRKLPYMPRKVQTALSLLAWPIVERLQKARLRYGIRRVRPELVVISQGANLDGLFLREEMEGSALPYAVVSQKATDMYWPGDNILDEMRSFYAGARACYFVSQHNLRLTEEQTGTRLPNASVVRNPFLVPWQRDGRWPDSSAGLSLACVGRVYPREKGQDLLIRVLARDKWKERPFHITFFGSGQHERRLREMARLLGVENVSFGGFTSDPASIWDDHHALILTSRAEGLPLVIVEAMLSGRVVIATDVAGANEVVTDDANGFLAASPTEDSIDEAMERAWNRRGEWRAIGDKAAEDIRGLVPSDPARAFADKLLELIPAGAALP